MENAISKPLSRTRALAFTGLSIALITASAWIVVPLGPVPFTLQMLAIPLVLCVLKPKEAVVTIYGYVVLGAIGVPVFSGMRGGIGTLMGPTGGFLIGYLLGVPLAVLFLMAARKLIVRNDANGDIAQLDAKTRILQCGANICAGLIFTIVAYIFGCIQYTFVGGVDLAFSFGVTVAPFIIPDIIKVVIAGICAYSVNRALSRL